MVCCSWFCSSDMDKMPKISRTRSPASLDNGVMKSYSVLSRCNSFSSCSNDSEYSNQKKFKNGKYLANHSLDVPKRSRNSSGSSISSNISCVSDKDLKTSRVISQTHQSKYQITKNSVKVPPTNYSNADTNNVELKEETIVNERLSCTNNSFTISPTQRTLRGKITKKGCTCCPSTRTTVVVRRYREIVKTTEKKTVISSTKVKTYVQKDTVPTTSHASKERDKISTKSKARKRRSEIEKLYESLHEIEWAKNFSPDNILRQINIRQAASCSIFGKSQIGTESLSKASTKQKVSNIQSSSPLQKSSSAKSSNFINEHVSSSCTVISNGSNQDFDSNGNLDKLQTIESTDSHCPEACNSQSLNESSKMSPLNVNKLNCCESSSIINGIDSSDDAQFSYTSDESSSSRTVSLQSKHLLGMHFKDRNGIRALNSEASEYSTPTFFNIAEEGIRSIDSAPTFFDIAEEGIRTIDACFREVGAEVIVSTCYDEENSLPMLTSATENGSTNKCSAEDSPPILEPCVNIDDEKDLKIACNKTFKKQFKIVKRKFGKNFSKAGNVNLKFNNLKLRKLRLKSKKKSLQNTKSKILKKCTYLSNKSNMFLIIKAGKRILSKYQKHLYKKKLKAFCGLSKSVSCKDELPKKLNSVEAEISTGNKNLSNEQFLSVSIPTSRKLSYKTEDKLAKESVINQNIEKKQYSYKHENRVTFGYTNNACFYDTRETINHQQMTQTHIAKKSESSVTECKSVVSSFVSTKHESDAMISKEHISRIPLSIGLFSPYRSIKVNRSINYTQIILKLTRGKSIFLTLEALTELTDVLIRTNNDSSCPVLIINGIGDSFCLGIDLKPLVGPRKNVVCTEMAIAIKGLMEALSDFKKPLAAVVNGPALGLGMTLLNHADLTIASDKATFCMPYSYLGYMPEGGATLTLPQVVGSTVAMDLLLRGRTLTALEARNVGLISEVLEAKYLPTELVSRVRLLAANSLSALETTKAVLKMQLHVNLRLVLDNEVKLLPRMWLTHSCQEALQKALNSGILSE